MEIVSVHKFNQRLMEKPTKIFDAYFLDDYNPHEHKEDKIRF